MAEWSVAASRSLPIDETSAWVGSDAKSSVWEWAGYNGDHPDAAKAKQAFLIYDASAPLLKGSFHLPFAAVHSGKLTALASGIRASASRLPQMDGPSDAIKAEARAVIDAYEKKFSTNNSVETDDEPGDRLVHAVPAPITRLYTSADQPVGSVTEPWMEACKRMALDPTIFDTHPPFPFRAHISNQRKDAYYTRMHETSLENYAADATQGVSFQNSHRETELGFGRSFRGECLGSAKNGTARTEADFYTIPGLNLNGVSTDDLIRGMQAGLVKDVSVGFYGGHYRCGTCGERLFSGECRHVPGLVYDRDGAAAADPSAPPSIAWVHDAHLAEVSAVYDGACPGAAIMKARQLSQAGHLPPLQARLLEERYRIRLPASERRWPGTDLTPPEETTMPEEPTLSPIPFGSSQLRALMEAAGLTPGESDDLNLRTLTETLRKLPEYLAERERLAKLADYGRAYHQSLIDEAVREGVRAFGPAFKVEERRVRYAGASVEAIQEDLALWKPLAAQACPGGGRQTADVGDPEPPLPPTHFTHPGAFAG
jgi:hypothetical protein